MSNHKTTNRPRLVEHNTLLCWLFPDGSYRTVTESDVEKLNRIIDHLHGLQIYDQ